MSVHTAQVSWSRGQHVFVDQRYSRAHLWTFDGGQTVPASASPSVVKVPWADPAAVDPEEAFVASLSSCHMLWFLSLAAGQGLLVDHYDDQAEATLGQEAQGHLAITAVVLRPRVALAPSSITRAGELLALHAQAHERCFLARSVRCPISIEPRQL